MDKASNDQNCLKCWEIKKCDSYPQCACYRENEIYCWSIESSLCKGRPVADHSEKLKFCEDCQYYQLHSGKDVFVYRVDAQGTLCYTSPNWDGFAAENQGQKANRQAVLGEKLGSQITGLEIQHLYKALEEKVAQTGRSATVTINCDAPDIRRVMKVSIIKLPQGGLEYRSRLVKTTKRKAIDLLGQDVQRNEELIRMCSYCKAIAVSESDWLPTAEAVQALKLFDQQSLPSISHGVCPTCYETLLSQLENM